jgi:hypothetical protein
MYMNVFVNMYGYVFVFVYVHNEFIYTHINSRLDYLKFKLIYLTNSNDKILAIIN